MTVVNGVSPELILCKKAESSEYYDDTGLPDRHIFWQTSFGVEWGEKEGSKVLSQPSIKGLISG